MSKLKFKKKIEKIKIGFIIYEKCKLLDLKIFKNDDNFCFTD